MLFLMESGTIKKSECTRKKECTYTNIHIQKKECTYIQDNRIGQKGCSMVLLDRLIEKAKQNPKRIVLSECDSERMLLAARTVLDSGIGFPVLVHDPAVINETAKTAGVDLTGMEIVDCTDPAAAEALVKETEDMLASGNALAEKVFGSVKEKLQ